ncbi:hypothetical protein, partial [Leptospira interrogans]|uniref:hypothetical protein n=1 Tax=Leptospira interrogans TaxID=173 RepID=UPI001F28AF9C
PRILSNLFNAIEYYFYYMFNNFPDLYHENLLALEDSLLGKTKLLLDLLELVDKVHINKLMLP